MRDPFEAVLPPHFWFGLICEGVQTDDRGRINFTSVFNQIQLFEPPAETNVPPYAFLNGILVVGFSEGLGRFELEVELRDVEDHTLWRRPDGRWAFEIGPTGPNGAVLAEEVRYWFTDSGRNHFWIRLLASERAHQIPFEIRRQIGPGEAAEAGPQANPQ